MSNKCWQYVFSVGDKSWFQRLATRAAPRAHPRHRSVENPSPAACNPVLCLNSWASWVFQHPCIPCTQNSKLWFSAMPCTVFWKITRSNVAVCRKIVTNCFRCREFQCLLIHSFTLGRKSFTDFQSLYATRGTPGKKHSAVSSARPPFCRLWMLQFFQVPRCLCV